MENLSSGSGIGGFSGGGGGAAAATAAPVAAAEPVKEKDAFDIKLTVVDPKSKIKIIKEVRALTGLGLKEVIVTIN
jgi:large subunit ribosomal protein L7/L12